MPPIGLLLGGVDFSDFFVVLKGVEGRTFLTPAEAKEAGADPANYGLFMHSVISFLVVAFAVFIVVTQINRLKRVEEAPPAAPTTKECSFCFTAIPINAVRCRHCTSQLNP